MFLLSLLITPLIGIFIISTTMTYSKKVVDINKVKIIGLSTTIINLITSLIIFILFDFSTNQYQFVQEFHNISNIDFYLGVDGISIYFVLLTSIIMPIAILSN